VRLGPSGFDRLVTVLRFATRVSADAEVKKRLVEEARLAAQVHSAGLAKLLGVGVLGPAFYLSTELVEGRSVRTVLATCRADGFPFGPDHALMVASRAAAALEPLAGRKDETRQAMLHGLLAPSRLMVAFDGEVKVKGLGLWNALREGDVLGPDERAYLAPEQSAGRGDARSDVYALGLVLLEMLSGEPLEGGDPLQKMKAARIASPGGERTPLPPPLVDLLRRALAPDPAARFASLAELRKAIDALLFGGDFTPTTFDLAFFMHTLFRDEVEQDARAAEQARLADYREFLSDDAGKAAASRAAQTEPADAGAAAAPTEAPAGAPTLVSPPTLPDPQRSPAPAVAVPPAARTVSGPDSSEARQSARRDREAGAREAGARDAAARLSLGGAEAPPSRSKRGAWLAIGLVVAALLGGGAGFLYFAGARRAAERRAPTPEQVAAEARVRELETRIAQLESEKAQAEARAAEEAKAAVEKQAAEGGTTADPAAIAAAQEAARRRARDEQERRQREELQRLADEKRAEEQRLAEAAAALAALEATPLPLAPATPAPTPTPLPAPIGAAGSASAPAASGHPGGPAGATETQLTAAATSAPPSPALPASPSPTPATSVQQSPVPEGDPGLVPPVLVSQPKLLYPPIALAARAQGTVELRVLVDESGNVAQVNLVRSSRIGVGFEAAAERHARGRKYRPATRQGTPVRSWIIMQVSFKLTK
jgi:TonB family protein